MEKKVELPGSGVSITANMPDGREVANYYTVDVGSGTMVDDSTTAIGVELPDEKKQEFIDTVDYAKTNKPYVSDVELSLTWKGFKFRVKREPAKVIRVYSEK